MTPRLPATFSILAVLAGCPSNAPLRAVDATAKAGTDLAQQRSAMEILAQVCAPMAALHIGGKCVTETQRWTNAVDAIVNYSGLLERVAQADGPNVRVDTARAESTLKRIVAANDDARDLATEGLKLLSHANTRRELQSTIRSADPAVEKVAALLLAHLRDERRAVHHLRCAVDCKAGLPTDGCPEYPADANACPPPADATSALTLARFDAELVEKERAIAAAAYAIKAFQEAHTCLANSSDDSSYEDVMSLLTKPQDSGAP